MVVVYDERYADHLAHVVHPESPQRVTRTAEHLASVGLLEHRIPARAASDAELLLAHPQSYLDRVHRDVSQLEGRTRYLSTGDTVIDPSSLEVARLAAGGTIVAMEHAVARSEATFALVRPPGHHAEPVRGMGFCLFNNAAVAARAYQARFGGRVLIVDFDYHHGNGTQAMASDGLSFVSTHAYPQYPGTGAASESRFVSDGAVVNVPLPPAEYGTEAFVATWQRLLPDVVRHARPDLIVASAGYDFATGDPVGDLGADGPSSSRALAELLREIAAEACGGRLVYVLEGGYDVATLSRCIEATIRVHDEREREGEAVSIDAVPRTQRAILDEVRAWAS
jgi:acetoin utilization deacetylase AcuC-like enzyme